MAIYIILILYILTLFVFSACTIPDHSKRETFILRMGMFAIFLLLALKKDTVGVDIIGYKDQYYLSAIVAWQDTSYVYFEPGYIQLMKLFSKAGLDFQVFAAVLYAISCRAYYKFIDRYSRNATLSLLIFICYQFLVFYTSGLRQALAMAICIYAFLVLDGRWSSRGVRICCAVLMVLAATTIHQSALLFLVVIAFSQWRQEEVHWILMLVALVAAVFLRPLVLQLINLFIGRVSVGTITLGGNFLFLVGISIFCVFAYYQRRENEQNQCFLPIMTNILMMSVVVQILFSGGPLLRSAMYLTLFVIPGLPYALKSYGRKIEIPLTCCLGIFLIWLFWTDTLSINQLNLCPYLFFWQ